MNIDKILKQILNHHKMFAWIIKETEKIARSIIYLETKKFNAKRYNELRDCLVELQLRYQQDRNQYKKTFKMLQKTFKHNYGIDIIRLLEDDVGAK